jgi:DNA-binding NarL/FixJ family response regulator
LQERTLDSLPPVDSVAFSKTMNTPRILIAERHVAMRRTLRAAVAEQVTWSVCGEVTTANEALAMTFALRPDIVLLDSGLSGRGSLALTSELSRTAPDSKVLVLSVHESAPLADAFREAGAQGYLLKPEAGRLLAPAIEALLSGRAFFSDHMPSIEPGGDAEHRGGADPSQLTPREREVLQWIAEGKSNKEVGAALSISVKTVETHRARILSKLDLHSMNALVRYALRNHLIDV